MNKPKNNIFVYESGESEKVIPGSGWYVGFVSRKLAIITTQNKTDAMDMDLNESEMVRRFMLSKFPFLRVFIVSAEKEVKVNWESLGEGGDLE